ncbi:hypothetical protein ABK040_011479 [Willaertia magna]
MSSIQQSSMTLEDAQRFSMMLRMVNLGEDLTFHKEEQEEVEIKSKSIILNGPNEISAVVDKHVQPLQILMNHNNKKRQQQPYEVTMESILLAFPPEDVVNKTFSSLACHQKQQTVFQYKKEDLLSLLRKEMKERNYQIDSASNWTNNQIDPNEMVDLMKKMLEHQQDSFKGLNFDYSHVLSTSTDNSCCSSGNHGFNNNLGTSTCGFANNNNGQLQGLSPTSTLNSTLTEITAATQKRKRNNSITSIGSSSVKSSSKKTKKVKS